MFERTFTKIQESVHEERYEITIPHFIEELIDEDMMLVDAETIVLTGKITRRFKGDPRGIRYEITGTTADGRKSAVICRLKETGIPLFITIYSKEEK